MFTQLFKPFTSYKYLLFQLVLREIKARYKQSILGYAWILFSPLVQLLVYSFVFSIVIKFPTQNAPYPIFLFIGLLPWIYLQTSISTSTLILVDNSNLLKKVNFPREILPYSVIMAKSIDLFFSLILLLIFIMFYQLPLNLTSLYAIPLLFTQVILMCGLSLMLSAANLFYRDIQYVTNLLLLMWMYLTPVVYPLSLVPEQYITIYQLNPMVGIIEGYRSAILNQSFDIPSILWSVTISLIIFILGYSLFKKSEKVFADIV